MNNIKKLKIGYFADGKWAHNAFNLLIKNENIQIMFVCVRYDTQDLVLKDLAINNGINYLKHENINSDEFLFEIQKYECDLFVSMSFNQIFKNEIINMPKMKTINCHAGKLPFYRGRNILNWALINDEKEFGITVHYMDEGIDTGDIILQRTYPINDNDSYDTLLEVAYNECANVLYDAILLIMNGEVKPIIQSTIHPVGFYCGMRTIGDEIVDWNKNSRDIFNFVRAICKPGPQARTSIKGIELKINKVEMINNAVSYKGIPGQIIGKIEGLPIVKTLDTMLIISEFDYLGVIRVGDRLK
ncbi:methionyl-tRNA formyltransferase [Acetoanaerobium noterae]|uniref:methionyl-tRNA formyltransferase n=1 Tax=Acetoanaerobium noterae TaxID=745369 RepID=UPI003329E4CD